MALAKPALVPAMEAGKSELGDMEQSQQMVELELKVNPETGEKKEEEKELKDEVEVEPEVKPEAEVKAEPEVKPEAEVKVEPEVKPEAEVKEAEVKPEAEVKAEPEVEVESDVVEEAEPEENPDLNDEQSNTEENVLDDPSTDQEQQDDDNMFEDELTKAEEDNALTETPEEMSLMRVKDYELEEELIAEEEATREQQVPDPDNPDMEGEGPALDYMGEKLGPAEEYFPNEEARVSFTLRESDADMMEEPESDSVPEEEGEEENLAPFEEMRDGTELDKGSKAAGQFAKGKMGTKKNHAHTYSITVGVFLICL